MVDSISLDWVRAGEGRPEVVAIAQAYRGFVEAATLCPSSTFDTAAKRGTLVEAVCQGLLLIAESPEQDIHTGRAADAAHAREGLDMMRQRALRNT